MCTCRNQHRLSQIYEAVWEECTIVYFLNNLFHQFLSVIKPINYSHYSQSCLVPTYRHYSYTRTLREAPVTCNDLRSFMSTTEVVHLLLPREQPAVNVIVQSFEVPDERLLSEQDMLVSVFR